MTVLSKVYLYQRHLAKPEERISPVLPYVSHGRLSYLVSCVAWLGSSFCLPTFVTSFFWKELKYRPTLLYCTWRLRKGQGPPQFLQTKALLHQEYIPNPDQHFQSKKIYREENFQVGEIYVEFVGQDFSSQSNWWAGTTVKGNCCLCILMHTICHVFARQQQYGATHIKPSNNIESVEDQGWVSLSIT